VQIVPLAANDAQLVNMAAIAATMSAPRA
jgi:hypothetical protein